MIISITWMKIFELLFFIIMSLVSVKIDFIMIMWFKKWKKMSTICILFVNLLAIIVQNLSSLMFMTEALMCKNSENTVSWSKLYDYNNLHFFQICLSFSSFKMVIYFQLMTNTNLTKIGAEQFSMSMKSGCWLTNKNQSSGNL